MRKKPGHCFEDPGFDPGSKVCAVCLEYVRAKCADRKARRSGEAGPGADSEADRALASATALDERFLDRVGVGFRRMTRMGVDVKQVVFRDGDGKVAVFAAYSRRTGRMKVSTPKRPKGRVFELKSAEEADALADKTAIEAGV